MKQWKRIILFVAVCILCPLLTTASAAEDDSEKAELAKKNTESGRSHDQPACSVQL
jgi:hypothetical protein